jgi:hypothetical protein
MDSMENFPRLDEFLTKFLGRFWPEVPGWLDRLSGCRVSIESISYSQADGSNHGVFTTVLLQLFPCENSAKYAESGNVFNTNHGMFIFTVGRHGQIDEIEMYFSIPQAPPFFEELIPLHPSKSSKRFKAMLQEARAAGAWTCDEFMKSIDYEPMHVVNMDE